MLRRGRRLGLILAVVMLLLAGCWNRRELEEYAFVLALGIDRGERDTFAVTAAIAIPALIAGEEGKPAAGGPEQPLVVTTVEAPTVAIAIQMMDSWIDRRVSLLHAKTVFVSEEQAREDALAPIRQLVRFREARRTMFFAITKGRADQFLEKMDIRIERDPQRFVQQLASAYLYTGFVPEMAQLHDALLGAESKRRTTLAYYVALREEDEEDWARRARPEGHQHAGAYTSGEIPRKGGPNVDMMGAAVLGRREMVGLLSGQETRWTLIVKNRFRRGYFTVSDPMEEGKHITLDIRVGRPPQVTAEADLEDLQIRVALRLEGEIISIEGGTDYTSPELRPVLEQAVKQQMERQLHELVAKAQKDLKIDIFELGQQFVHRFATVDEWNRFDWPRRFPDAKIDMTVDMQLRRFGTQLAPAGS